MEVRLQGAAAASDEAVFPACRVAGLRFGEGERGWQLDFALAPWDVRELVGELQWVPAAQVGAQRSWRGPGEQLLLDVRGEPGEWEAFEADPPEPELPDWGHSIELLMFDPGLAQQPPLQAQLAGAVVTVEPGQSQLALEVPVRPEDLPQLLERGYRLEPADSGTEELCWEDIRVGFVYKPVQRDPGLERLAALEHALSHPFLYRPWLAGWEQFDTEELERLIDESFDPAEGWSDLPEELQEEFSGIDQSALEPMLGLCLALVAAAGEELDQDEPPERWNERVFLLTLCSVLAGSRSCRAEATRQGYETIAAPPLSELQLQHLINGLLTSRDALREASLGRSDRVWELPPQSACVAETELSRQLQQEGEGDPLLREDVVFALMTLGFDLGVRYQTLRVAPDLLLPTWSADEGDQENSGNL